MDEQGIVEFHHADGQVTTGEFTDHSFVPRHKGDRLVHDGAEWLIFDRRDRDGVAVYLCKPA